MQAAFCRAYLLHSKPFRESSLLSYFFTEQGQIKAIARGARRPKSHWRSSLQAFTPLTISWYGQQELVTLKSAESCGYSPPLLGYALLSGLYMNELLVRLLELQEPLPTLFQVYEHTLQQLPQVDQLEKTLRYFELTLLQTLGYGLDFITVADSGEYVTAEQFYKVSLETGVCLASAEEITASGMSPCFSGEHLLAIAQADFSNVQVLKSAKRLMRQLIHELLGGKPLNSRLLFSNVLIKKHN